MIPVDAKKVSRSCTNAEIGSVAKFYTAFKFKGSGCDEAVDFYLYVKKMAMVSLESVDGRTFTLLFEHGRSASVFVWLFAMEGEKAVASNLGRSRRVLKSVDGAVFVECPEGVVKMSDYLHSEMALVGAGN